MTKNKLKVLIISAFLVIVVCCTQMQKPGDYSTNNTVVNNNNSNVSPSVTPSGDCPASADWVSNPQNAPAEIPGGGQNLCQFHQFSWQWFLAMINVAGDSRTFENQQNYPLYQGTGVNSCAATTVKNRIFVRTFKDKTDSNNDFVLPQDIKQAGDNATVYDQNGNVVYYEARFSREMCLLPPPPPPSTPTPSNGQTPTPAPEYSKMFPAGTTEIKVSYRVITDADKPNYIWINADINGDGKIGPTEILGMVGFHLVKSTALHPEFVWATFEHKSNVPECQAAADASKDWSFTSDQCAAQLPNSVDPKVCNFNSAQPGTVLSGGPPTQICRVYHDSSKTGDNQFDSNVSDIDQLNTQLTGPSGFITALPATSPLAALKNYMLVGALWENDITLPSGPLPDQLANQRGSIQLANATMETTYQQAPGFTPMPYTGTSNLQPATNCFACHGYTPGNNVAESHIFRHIQGK